MSIPPWFFPRTRSFWYGFTLPWEALKLIVRKPLLILWCLIPLAITVTLYVYLIQGLQGWVDLNVHHLVSGWGWNESGWAAWSVILLSRLIVFIAGALTFSIAASLFASPFNDFLAEATERYATPPLAAVPALAWRKKLRLVWLDLGKTAAAAIASLAAILFSWIPLLNLIAMAAAFLLMTFQYISYPQTRRGLSIGQGALFIWRHLYASLGFGAILSILFAIPLLSILIMPLAVVGGTLLVARTEGAPRLK